MSETSSACAIQNNPSFLNLYYPNVLYQMCPNLWHIGTQHICRAWELHNEVTKNNAKQIRSVKQVYNVVLGSFLSHPGSHVGSRLDTPTRPFDVDFLGIRLACYRLVSQRRDDIICKLEKVRDTTMKEQLLTNREDGITDVVKIINSSYFLHLTQSA